MDSVFQYTTDSPKRQIDVNKYLTSNLIVLNLVYFSI